MVNYDKSTIYKLCCKDPEITDIYVGSTTNFSRRKSRHKQRCNNENSDKYYYKVYKTIREYGGWSNWDMVEIEKYCSTDKKDLHSRERFWLEELGATLNKIIPTQSKAEYRAKNKEKIVEYNAKYRAKNKDKIAEQKAEYRAKNKDKIAEYRAKNKDKIAEYNAKYYDKNKDKIAERDAEYYAKNKEKYIEQFAERYAKNKEKLSEKVECGCGSEIRKDNLSRHRKSKKHQKWVEQNSES